MLRRWASAARVGDARWCRVLSRSSSRSAGEAARHFRGCHRHARCVRRPLPRVRSGSERTTQRVRAARHAGSRRAVGACGGHAITPTHTGAVRARHRRGVSRREACRRSRRARPDELRTGRHRLLRGRQGSKRPQAPSGGTQSGATAVGGWQMVTRPSRVPPARPRHRSSGIRHGRGRATDRNGGSRRTNHHPHHGHPTPARR